MGKTRDHRDGNSISVSHRLGLCESFFVWECSFCHELKIVRASEKEARRAVMKVTKELKKGGIIIISKPELKIQNIVASASLGGMIDLEKAAYTLGKTMYEPEQFPGLIYRMDEPKVVILLFASGKLVCTGAKKEADGYTAVHKLHGILEEQNLIFYE
jgi:transcription initiation factor TFIID TATA-box-binding protein